MALEMNVLNGIFYKGKIFQPKYHWVEIKFLVAIRNPRWQFFCLRENAFLSIRRYLPRECRILT